MCGLDRENAMKFSRMRDGLRQYLHNGMRTQQAPLAQLDHLIEALEQKEALLQQQLAAESDPARRRHLKIELAVARVQHNKGLARRLELQRTHG